jgi:hypothetical protein
MSDKYGTLHGHRVFGEPSSLHIRFVDTEQLIPELMRDEVEWDPEPGSIVWLAYTSVDYEGEHGHAIFSTSEKAKQYIEVGGDKLLWSGKENTGYFVRDKQYSDITYCIGRMQVDSDVVRNA